VILLPRSEAQRAEYETRKLNVTMPHEALDGANLIAAADLVISAGGTMNREAAALGVPAASIFAGKWAAIDEELVREGRLRRIGSRAEIESLAIRKKQQLNPRNATSVKAEITRLILE
jgi:predicted glycosyltransferase